MPVSIPTVDELPAIIATIAGWQADGMPIQLHPGDLGWAWQTGAPSLADRVRVWRRDGRMLAVGLLDGPTLLRLALAPKADDDEGLAEDIVADLSTPTAGVLPHGPASVEARFGSALRSRLDAAGWISDEAWTPLSLDLTDPVAETALRVVTVTPDLAEERAAVQRASFDGSTFSIERWNEMVAGPAYRDARCLIGYDDRGDSVALTTVWSAGSGRPGLIEPLGVHRDHRGHGHGRAITLAAAEALRDLGSSSALVCTPSDNVGAVATYTSAAFTPHPKVTDFRRPEVE